MDSSRTFSVPQPLRKVLIVVAVAIAVLIIGWFVYAHFFVSKNNQAVIDASHEGIANSIRRNTQPTPTIVRYDVLTSIRKNSTPATSTNGEFQNTTPQSEREAILKSFSQRQ